MDDLISKFAQNLPEMLVRDLADQEHVFLARSISAGPPAAKLAFAESQAPPPHVPNRNPGRVAGRVSHRAAPETVLCSLKQSNQGAAWRHEREDVLIDALTRRSSLHAHKHQPMPDLKEYNLMKRDMETDVRPLFHGHNEDWGSDTSAELAPGMSSPRSVRTRQQSVTTAATSVDAQFVAGGRVLGAMGFESVPCSPEKLSRFAAGDDGESWVDLDPEMVRTEDRMRRQVESPRMSEELHRPRTAPSTGFTMKGNSGMEQTSQPSLPVPKRRSSLSHQVSSIILGETAHSRNLAPQARPMPSSRSLPHQLSGEPATTHGSWEEPATAWAPVVPLGRRHPRRDPPNDASGAFLPPSEEVSRHRVARQNAPIDPPECFAPPKIHHFDDTLLLHSTLNQLSLNEKDSRSDFQTMQDDSADAFPPPPSDPYPSYQAFRQNLPAKLSEAVVTSPEMLAYRRVPRQNLRLDLPESFPLPPNPLSCHQVHPQNSQPDLSQAKPFDELSLPPLSLQDTNHYDALSMHQSDYQHSVSRFKPRKSQNGNRVPLLNNIQHWLESSTNAQQVPSPTLSPSSPTVSSPSSGKIRIPVAVLENISAMVKGFPETMLSTNTFAVQMVRDYSRMVKRDHISPGNDGNVSSIVQSPITPLQTQSHSQPQPLLAQSRTLGRKGSRPNLGFVSSLRGKLSGRLVSSATAPDMHSLGQKHEAAFYDGNSASSIVPEKKKTDGCVISLRIMFPNGTDYLLDALYANILVYNYITSICGGPAIPPPPPHQSGPADSSLRVRPSKNFALPTGVTSLADLDLQPDSSETILQDWHDDLASTVSMPMAVVPAKAMLVLGMDDANNNNNNMGRHPLGGSRVGRQPPAGRKPAPSVAGSAVRGNSLSSDAVMAELRDDLAHSIYRLVETMKTGSGAESNVSEDEDSAGIVCRPNGSQLDPTLMSALCEVVRCYEEITALRGGA